MHAYFFGWPRRLTVSGNSPPPGPINNGDRGGNPVGDALKDCDEPVAQSLGYRDNLATLVVSNLREGGVQ
jgi:hypothetical protein